MPTNDRQARERQAALFIDFENLYERLQTYLADRDRPEDIIIEMVEELRRYLRELNHTRTAAVYAFADFQALEPGGERIKKELYLAGIEPRFVPAQLQKNAAELQLCVDASDMLHNRSQTESFVVLTGDRFYLPLIQQFKRFGCHTFVAAFSLPPSNTSTPRAEEDLFLDAMNLLSEATRERIAIDGYGDASDHSSASHHALSTQEARRTVEIIEEHFGQYDEVYLTPLLRKLSEMLGPQSDPKAVVNELEDAGAVWLEKRRGSPYDYTVLLVDYKHPDVKEICESRTTPEYAHDGVSVDGRADADGEFSEYRRDGEADRSESVDAPTDGRSRDGHRHEKAYSYDDNASSDNDAQPIEVSVDGQADGRVDGQELDGQVDGQQLDGQADVQIDAQVDGQADDHEEDYIEWNRS